MSFARLEVRIPERFNSRIEDLAEREGLTKTDVFRRALALYLMAKDEERSGSKLQVVNGDRIETLVNL